MKTVKTSSLLAALTLAASATPALALEAGDVLLRVGAAHVAPDVTDDVANGALKLDVESDTQLGLTLTYMLQPSLGIEVLAASPFGHDVVAGSTTVASTKQLPPTITVQWYPAASGKLQPYLGLGLNITTFWDAELNATGKAATGAQRMSLKHSTGLALEAGLDYALDNGLFINAAIWKIDIDTDVSLDGTDAGTLEIDPLAMMIGVGKKF